jgi:hypothetical protein
MNHVNFSLSTPMAIARGSATRQRSFAARARTTPIASRTFARNRAEEAVAELGHGRFTSGAMMD